jgi:hypothetical protein
MARFPDSRNNRCARLPKPKLSDGTKKQGPQIEARDPRTERSVAAYSGGTVWVLHPLRVAAGANVKLSTSGFDRTVRV